MAVTFSANTKTEMCKLFPQKGCCALSQCFGILLFCNSFGTEGIRIITESREFAQILPRLFKKAFSLTFDQIPLDDNGGKLVFSIHDKDKLDAILSAFGFSRQDTLAMHVNLSILENDCCKSAFLRGAFLAGGSVTDPAKGYHLEMTTTHKCVSKETYALVEDVLGFYPKEAQRGGGQVLYLKQSDHISDFLTYLAAPVAAMGIMEAKLEKEISNKVNRRCNCDEANTSKVVEAAQEQLLAIRVLKERGILEHLSKKLYLAACAREKNPEASLTELAEMMEPPITKPAMNHRLKKLMELAKEAGK